jgi:AcrR family transcriptional regulator
MISRDKLLRAATELYAETGFRGTTTRRIARRAGVNEVTLFRQFGSKNALLQEAIRCACRSGEPPGLPARPGDVRQELLGWSRLVWEGLWRHRGVIRTSLCERETFPELSPRENAATVRAARELTGYLRRLKARGRIGSGIDVASAAALYLGALFTDAMSRDVLPFLYPRPPAESIAKYLDLFVHALRLSLPRSRAATPESR